uniref:BPTI/Kunitz inhibitor domain-containing protein n=1 Tax=Gallus gallus TaxID=9031 RepID=A0A8V0YTE6_CHICK
RGLWQEGRGRREWVQVALGCTWQGGVRWVAEAGCAADICHLPAVPGPCGGHELSFFYNVTSGRCETFPYSGCGGNANRFGTRAACRRACLGHGEGTELWVMGVM